MIRLFRHYISYNVVLLSLIDLMLLVLAGELAWRFRVAQIGAAVGQISDRALEIVAFSAVIWVAMIAVGSYGHQALRSIRFATVGMTGGATRSTPARAASRCCRPSRARAAPPCPARR